MFKVLIIDDDESLLATLESYLDGNPYQVHLATDGEAGLIILESEHPDVLITDLLLPGINGLEILKRAKEFDKSIPVIVITALEDMQTTINAIQEGAYDYLSKPIEYERFNVIIKRALESKQLSERLSLELTQTSGEFNSEGNLIGATPVMKEIFKQIGHVSNNRLTVLIQGETGTGKEIIARVIHHSGITKEYPFIAVNCSALTETLLESELFGHVKGAFTGAIRNKKGKFELAGEGTIFLDEISEVSPTLQVKLLRVVQEKEFERVGGETTIPVTARIITSTNRDLEELVKLSKFRDDLYYRLNVVSIKVPPLSERREDIPKLVLHFLEKINRELHKNVNKVPYEVMEMLNKHTWGGNVRELENVLTRAVALAKGDVLEKELIMISNNRHTGNISFPKLCSLEQLESDYIKYVLDYCEWDKKKALEILQIGKTTLYNKIEQYKLKRD